MASARTDRLPSIYRGFVPATTTSAINPLAGSRPGDRGRANSRDVGAVVAAAAAAAAGSGTTATTAAAAAAAVGSGNVDRRRLWGVGTFLIDTPKDSALQVRQRLLRFQERHRGPLGVKSPGEALPGIPFRLNPNPEVPQRSASDSHVPPVLMVDAATSPMMPFDEDSNSNLGPSETALSAPSTARSVTFLTDQDQDQDQEVTTTTKLPSSLLGDKTTTNASANANAAEFGKAKTVSILVKKASQGTSMRSLTTAVSFSERPPRKSIPRRVRECSKIGILSSEGSPRTTTTGTNTATTAAAERARELQQQHQQQQQQMQLPGPLGSESYAIERLPRLPPDTARSRQTLLTNSPRKSASVSDLTDVGSIFSWHDMEFEVRTSRSFDMDSDNVGPTSFFQSRNKSKSLLDLLKLSRKGGRGGGGGGGGEGGGGAGGGGGRGGGEEDDSRKLAAADFSAAYHRRQRIAQLAFRRENSRLQRQPSGTLASSEADKEWLEMVNTQVIDKADYDKFASSRKPVTPAAGSSKKHAAYSGPFRPKSGTDFRLSQPAKGKVYPVFFNDGSPVRKFGRALPLKRKLFKSKQ